MPVGIKLPKLDYAQASKIVALFVKNKQAFAGEFDLEVCKLIAHEINVTNSAPTPYYPQGNRQTERFNRTLCGMVRSIDPPVRKHWPELLVF